MKIIAADDEISALNILNRAIMEAVPDAELRSFRRASDVIREVSDNGYRPDVAFLDIEMPGMAGLELARVLKTISGNVNIVFVTGFSQYALEALALRPSGYIMKPATEGKILAELENLRNPPDRRTGDKRIRVQCFGSFEVFIDGKPMKFIRSKSREVLAYLIDRHGAGCSSAEIAEAIWEDGVYDRSRQKQMSVIRLDLIKSLKQAGIEEILIKSRDLLSVDPTRFDCDYYMALAGDMVMLNKYIGEYMMPYSWAETANAALTARIMKNQE